MSDPRGRGRCRSPRPTASSWPGRGRGRPAAGPPAPGPRRPGSAARHRPPAPRPRCRRPPPAARSASGARPSGRRPGCPPAVRGCGCSGAQPVVDGDDGRAPAGWPPPAHRVVRVEVADRPATAVQPDHDRSRAVAHPAQPGPVDAQRQRAARAVDAAVLDVGDRLGAVALAAAGQRQGAVPLAVDGGVAADEGGRPPAAVRRWRKGGKCGSIGTGSPHHAGVAPASDAVIPDLCPRHAVPRRPGVRDHVGRGSSRGGSSETAPGRRRGGPGRRRPRGPRARPGRRAGRPARRPRSARSSRCGRSHGHTCWPRAGRRGRRWGEPREVLQQLGSPVGVAVGLGGQRRRSPCQRSRTWVARSPSWREVRSS